MSLSFVSCVLLHSRQNFGCIWSAKALLKMSKRNIKYEQDMNNVEIALLTIQDVAKLLKVSDSTVRRLQQGRHLPFIKIGGSIRFDKDDVLVFLKNARVESIG